ncbi:MAG TPA: hypothetical protein VLG09_06315 [Candidatus Saccharimonadales bacterium]|nr:hypothetical protein [Candidatus Saccharimonadales bacterium]
MTSRRIAEDLSPADVTFEGLTRLLEREKREVLVAQFMCNGRETQPIKDAAALQVLRDGVGLGSVTELQFYASTNGLVDVLWEWPDN